MEYSGNAPVGVDMRVYERTILSVHHISLFKVLCKRKLDNVATRCAKSGRCICDLHPRTVAEHTDVAKLGCPGWCLFAVTYDATDPSDISFDDNAI